MKIYQMNDCDWMMANSKEEALEAYALYGDQDDCEGFRELSSEELEDLEFYESFSDRESSRSFAEELKRRVDAGACKPDLFASTEG